MANFKKILMLSLMAINLVAVGAPDYRFCFDIHDVILTPEKKRVSKNLFRYGQLKKVMRSFNRSLSWSLLKNISFSYSGDYYYHLALKHNNQPLADLIESISNAYTPIDGTVSIINQLADQGYLLDIGSNIGPAMYAKLKIKYPAIFNQFQPDTHHVVDYQSKKIIKKPSIDFFKQYLKKNSIQNPATVIFIDDKKENVASAKKAGLTALHFKTPQKLQADLYRLGIIVTV